jgi:asparagine synthase (glutamine-hydrolysing)
MCGITAIFGIQKPINALLIKKMTNLLRHRGPDDEGFVVFQEKNLDNRFSATPFAGQDTPEAVRGACYPYTSLAVLDEDEENQSSLVFGHRRLSIVDLSPAGHQPMCTPDERFWIVYNGEIYNHRELRKELESLGCRFSSHADTEVILHSYALWGKECLHRFNGMWAFVIFDTHTGKIFISRDRFGIKPLYYWHSVEGFVAIASEIKAFIPLPGWNPKINGPRVYDFLISNCTDHTCETLFQDVFQLRGGEAIEVNIKDLDKPIPVYRWYELKSPPFNGNYSQAIQQFSELFSDSVKLRTSVDVPIGSCLSGGLDSSSIVCIVNQLLKKENCADIQHTISSCSEIELYDERVFIEELTGNRSIFSSYVYPSFDRLTEILDDIIFSQDEPFGSASIFAQWLVFEAAHTQNLKVMLDGQGSDEQLSGYDLVYPYWFAYLCKSGRWMEMCREIKAVRNLYGQSIVKSLHTMSFHCFPTSMVKYACTRLKNTSFYRMPKWVNTEFLRPDPEFGYLKNVEISSPREYALHLFLYSSLPHLLHWEDRNSMAHSIEARIPFLDYRLVEFIMGLPEDYLIHNGYRKRILRDSMKGILPEKIRLRADKMGFETPEEFWVQVENPEFFRKMVKKSLYPLQNVINNDINEILEKQINGTERYNHLIWRIICLARWVEIFKVSMEENKWMETSG